MPALFGHLRPASSAEIVSFSSLLLPVALLTRLITVTQLMLTALVPARSRYLTKRRTGQFYRSRFSTTRSTVIRTFTTMTASETDAIVKQLFDRPLPPLEPGTTVYDKSLVDRIAKLQEHMFVVACESITKVYANALLIPQRFIWPTTTYITHT
jgi:hypothetical protein